MNPPFEEAFIDCHEECSLRCTWLVKLQGNQKHGIRGKRRKLQPSWGAQTDLLARNPSHSIWVPVSGHTIPSSAAGIGPKMQQRLCLACRVWGPFLACLLAKGFRGCAQPLGPALAARQVLVQFGPFRGLFLFLSLCRGRGFGVEVPAC